MLLCSGESGIYTGPHVWPSRYVRFEYHKIERQPILTSPGAKGEVRTKSYGAPGRDKLFIGYSCSLLN